MEKIDLKKGSDLEWLMVVIKKQKEIIDWINKEEKARRENTDLCEWMKIQQLEQLGKIIEGMKDKK